MERKTGYRHVMIWVNHREAVVAVFVGNLPTNWAEIYGKGVDRLHEDHDRIMGSIRSRRWAQASTKALDEFLQKNRGIGVRAYINSFLDVAEVWVTGDFNQELDMWGVGRKEIRHLRKHSNQAIVLANANLFETA